MVMADILRGLTVPLGGFAVTYSDNIGIIVPSGAESDLEEQLRAAFASHGAGPFEITTSTSPITSEFKFLGYWWKVNHEGPHAFIRETEAVNWELAVTSNIMMRNMAELDRIEQHVRGKCASWALWLGSAPLLERMLANIQIARDHFPYYEQGTAQPSELEGLIEQDWDIE